MRAFSGFGCGMCKSFLGIVLGVECACVFLVGGWVWNERVLSRYEVRYGMHE